MTIQRITVGAEPSRDEDRATSHPERTLNMEVCDGIAWLTFSDGELGLGNDPNEYFIKIPARSLSRALDLAIEDSEAPKPVGLDG